MDSDPRTLKNRMYDPIPIMMIDEAIYTCLWLFTFVYDIQQLSHERDPAMQGNKSKQVPIFYCQLNRARAKARLEKFTKSHLWLCLALFLLDTL